MTARLASLALLLLPLLLAQASAQQPLEAAVQANPPRATAPATIHFHVVPEGGSPPYTFAWDLGDGLTSVEQVAARDFATGGTYHVRVTITDSAGARASAGGSVEVARELQVVAGSDFRGGQAPLDVTLEASALGGTPPYTFTWDLGSDGGLVEGQVQRVHVADGCACVFSVQVRDAWGALAAADVHLLTDPPSSAAAGALPFIALGVVLLAGIVGARLVRRN